MLTTPSTTSKVIHSRVRWLTTFVEDFQLWTLTSWNCVWIVRRIEEVGEVWIWRLLLCGEDDLGNSLIQVECHILEKWSRCFRLLKIFWKLEAVPNVIGSNAKLGQNFVFVGNVIIWADSYGWKCCISSAVIRNNIFMAKCNSQAKDSITENNQVS